MFVLHSKKEIPLAIVEKFRHCSRKFTEGQLVACMLVQHHVIPVLHLQQVYVCVWSAM